MAANVGGSSIRRIDLLSLSNLRPDGRKPNEIRRLRIQLGALESVCDNGGGNALVEMGLTVALATVVGPTEARRRTDEQLDRASIDVTVQLAPFSDAGMRRRVNPNQDRRLVEMSDQIQSALESCVLVQLYPQSVIQINICILQDDGSRLPCALNAAMCAILDAGIPTKDICCACTAGYPTTTTSFIDSSSPILIDLNRKEELGNGPGSVVVLPCAILPQRSNAVVWTYCETGRLPSIDTMERLLESAIDGCRLIFEQIQIAVRERASSVLLSRTGKATVSNMLVPVKRFEIQSGTIS